MSVCVSLGKTLAIATLASAFGALPAVAKPSAVRICKDHTHVGIGDHKVKETAMETAAGAWKAAVIAHDGPTWAGLANLDAVQCLVTDPAKSFPWHCWIERAPCRMQPTEFRATPAMPDLQIAPGN